MPFSPSDFEWYIWLLFALLAGLVFAGVLFLADIMRDDGLTKLVGSVVAVVVAVSGIGCFLIALVRFAKWAWGS
jgi:hypothetical protein